MTPYQHPHRVVLLESSFRYPDRRLFFARARLFLDRIELSGWHLGKRQTQRIPLDELDRIEWNVEAAQAVFHHGEGEPILLQLPQVRRWKESVEQRLSWSAPGRFRMAVNAHGPVRRDLPLNELVTLASAMG